MDETKVTQRPEILVLNVWGCISIECWTNVHRMNLGSVCSTSQARSSGTNQESQLLGGEGKRIRFESHPWLHPSTQCGIHETLSQKNVFTPEKVG